MSNVNLLILPDWVQQNIQQIYTAKTPQDFDTAFEAFIATNARIQFNGKHISREQYKTTIRGEIFDEAGASVTFNSVVSVQDPNSELTGAVGLFFTAELFHKFLVFGAEQANTVSSSLNVEVVEEPSANPNVGDHRRVSVLSEVLTDKPNPILPPTPLKA